MSVTNPVRDAQRAAIPSSATPETLASAIAQLDLDAIPPERRAQALLDHVGRVMVATCHDRQLAQAIVAARLKAMLASQGTPAT